MRSSGRGTPCSGLAKPTAASPPGLVSLDAPLPGWCSAGAELLMVSISLPPLGHKDSVTCAGFSHDSVFVATGDMSGLIKVWRVDAKEEVWSFEVGDLEVSWRAGGGTWGSFPSLGAAAP